MKILCITNNPISLNNANGKFIRNYLFCFSDYELSNFYITNDEPATGINSFNVTNYDALLKLITLGLHKRRKKSTNNNGNIKNTSSPIKHIFRYIVWSTGFWKLYGFKKWIANTNPTHIVLAIGDNPYLIKLAYDISKKFRIPIINIIGENYSIKNYNYLTKENSMSFLYKAFKKILFKITKKAILKAKINIFNTPTIEREYKVSFGTIKSAIFYPPADFIIRKSEKIEKDSVLYAGNLGLGRENALLDFADELWKFNPNKTIYVYSKIDIPTQKLITKRQNIKYMGYVPNSELNEIIFRSELVLHVEYNSQYNIIDLKTAFSTKIANNIIFGNNFFVFAPVGLAETDFFLKYLPENIATKKEEIIAKLNRLYSKKIILPAIVSELLDITITSSKIKELILK